MFPFFVSMQRPLAAQLFPTVLANKTLPTPMFDAILVACSFGGGSKGLRTVTDGALVGAFVSLPVLSGVDVTGQLCGPERD
jgi:uncharacterized protein YqgC (DUF456 family)